MTKEPEAEATGARLVHPVYLDVPMMVSFLAALRGGVSFEDTTTRRDASTSSTDREGSGKIRLPPLGALLGFDVSGRMGRKDGSEVSEETQAVRQHTAASLFNALHAVLEEDRLVSRVRVASDLDSVVAGDVIHVSGEFVGNPLEPVLAFMKQAAPYFDLASEKDEDLDPALRRIEAEVAEAAEAAAELKARASDAGRSGNPAMKAQAERLRAEAVEKRETAREGRELLETLATQRSERHDQEVGIRMLDQVRQDLDETPVHDTVINASDFKVILTMSAEFFTETTKAHLRAGMFSAIGKVTRVLDDDHPVNLLRRTVLGAADVSIGRTLIEGVVKDGSLQIETFDPVVKAPAVQVLPLAVFL